MSTQNFCSTGDLKSIQTWFVNATAELSIHFVFFQVGGILKFDVILKMKSHFPLRISSAQFVNAAADETPSQPRRYVQWSSASASSGSARFQVELKVHLHYFRLKFSVNPGGLKKNVCCLHRERGQRGFKTENSDVGGSDGNLCMSRWEWKKILS